MESAIVILYSRVSTDEQNKGYSPEDQKDKLYKDAEQTCPGDELYFFHDDESGKSFDRPEWLKIMAFIKKNKGKVKFIKFVKWDRFARNVAEAYMMIKELRKLGVEPQAIEQPLDFNVPESKIMLAIYLAVPEVDNDRRALNTFNGMRRAKKCGRWMGGYLLGYKKARDEKDKPIMIPEGGKIQELVVRAFKEMETGFYVIEDLRRKMNQEGLKIDKMTFWSMLRNKGYTGKVFVPAYKDEPAEWVNGIHPALIDENTFYNVQEVLSGRKKKNMPDKFVTVRDELPLRGFLQCPRCGGNLTGSASRGMMGKRFFYYHCRKGCKERQPAQKVNQGFYDLLLTLKMDEPIVDLYGEMLRKELKGGKKQIAAQQKLFADEIEKNKFRLKNAKTMRLDGELSSAEYKEMKVEIESEISRLNWEQSKLGFDGTNYLEQVDFCIYLLKNLDKHYQLGDTLTKQRLISSVFPEKIIYENQKCRTAVYNEAIREMCNEIKHLQMNLNEKRTPESALYGGVARTRIEL